MPVGQIFFFFFLLSVRGNSVFQSAIYLLWWGSQNYSGKGKVRKRRGEKSHIPHTWKLVVILKWQLWKKNWLGQCGCSAGVQLSGPQREREVQNYPRKTCWHQTLTEWKMRRGERHEVREINKVRQTSRRVEAIMNHLHLTGVWKVLLCASIPSQLNHYCTTVVNNEHYDWVFTLATDKRHCHWK